MISHENWMVTRSASPAWVSNGSILASNGRKSTDTRTLLLIYKASKIWCFSKNSSFNGSFHPLQIDGLGFSFCVLEIIFCKKSREKTFFFFPALTYDSSLKLHSLYFLGRCRKRSVFPSASTLKGISRWAIMLLCPHPSIFLSLLILDHIN